MCQSRSIFGRPLLPEQAQQIAYSCDLVGELERSSICMRASSSLSVSRKRELNGRWVSFARARGDRPELWERGLWSGIGAREACRRESPAFALVVAALSRREPGSRSSLFQRSGPRQNRWVEWNTPALARSRRPPTAGVYTLRAHSADRGAGRLTPPRTRKEDWVRRTRPAAGASSHSSTATDPHTQRRIPSRPNAQP
jgi:hypothetical protein